MSISNALLIYILVVIISFVVVVIRLFIEYKNGNNFNLEEIWFSFLMIFFPFLWIIVLSVLWDRVKYKIIIKGKKQEK